MSTVIKSQGERKSGQAIHTVAFNLDDLSLHAQRYLEQVRIEATKILTDAKQEAARLRQQAEQQGRQAATQAAEKVLEEKVGQRMKTLLPALRESVQQVQTQQDDWVRHWEERVVRLAGAMAAHILKTEVKDLPETTLMQAREALSLATASRHIRLLLNPTDQETLGGQIELLAQEYAKLGEIEVVADASISPGGCKVLTNYGYIDQQLDTQLARIQEELT